MQLFLNQHVLKIFLSITKHGFFVTDSGRTKLIQLLYWKTKRINYPRHERVGGVLLREGQRVLTWEGQMGPDMWESEGSWSADLKKTIFS